MLCARVEHHFAMLFFFAKLDRACKWVQIAICSGPASRRLTVAFGYVVPIMTANNPMLKIATLRKHLFIDYPHDLHPRNSRSGGARRHVPEFATP